MNYRYLPFVLVFALACQSSQKGSDQEQKLNNEETAQEEMMDSEDISENQTKSFSATPPSEEETGIPYYPGADYIPSSGSGGLLLMFATENSSEDVTAFYKDKLEGWTYNETYGLFWDGSGDLGYADILGSHKSVMIGPYDVGSYHAAINITIPE